jgi:hypothetical protein
VEEVSMVAAAMVAAVTGKFSFQHS